MAKQHGHQSEITTNFDHSVQLSTEISRLVYTTPQTLQTSNNISNIALANLKKKWGAKAIYKWVKHTQREYV